MGVVAWNYRSDMCWIDSSHITEDKILIISSQKKGGYIIKLEKCRKCLADILETLAGDVISLTGCTSAWGEVELPDCLRDFGNDCQDSEKCWENRLWREEWDYEKGIIFKN